MSIPCIKNKRLLAYCDNLPTVRPCHKGYSKRTAALERAMGTRLDVICDMIKGDIVELWHVPGKINPADIHTKMLLKVSLRSNKELHKIRSISTEQIKHS